MTPTDYALVALVLAVASFVQSACGFGFALVAVSALPQIIGLAPAIALIAAFNLLVSVTTLWWNRGGFSWQKAWPLTLAICLTLPIGFWFLKSADPTLLLRVLGVILIVVALMDLRGSLLERRRKRNQAADPVDPDSTEIVTVAHALPAWSVWPLGLIGGLLGGAFNVAGPPVVAYAYSQPWSKTQTVAVLQTVFLICGLLRNGLMAASGDYTLQLFKWIAWSLPPALLAIWLGKLLLDRLPKDLLKVAVFTFILAMGVKYLVWGM